MKPFFAKVLAETWAMEPHRLAQLIESMRGDAFGDEGTDAPVSLPLDVRDGVAHIQIQGVMLKSCPAWLADWGFTGTQQIQDLVERAVDDDSVKRIELDVDSPGGMVSGVQSLADVVHAVRDLKPITANVKDLAASAAYWVASQAKRIKANRGAVLGSIGVYNVVGDFSKMLEDHGIKVHVVSSHELKGAGAFGSQITPAQLDDMRRHINSQAELFTGSVVRGRGMTAERGAAVSTGQIWTGEQAQALGLIDELEQAGAKHKEKRAMEIEKLKADLDAAQTRAAAVEQENKELRVKEEAARANLAAIQAEQRERLLEQYRNRIAPAALDAVRKVGEAMGAKVGDFETYLKALPVVTFDAPQGATPKQADANGGTGELSAEDKEIAELFGLAPDIFKKFNGAKYVEAHTGRVVFADGSVREVK